MIGCRIVGGLKTLRSASLLVRAVIRVARSGREKNADIFAFSESGSDWVASQSSNAGSYRGEMY